MAFSNPLFPSRDYKVKCGICDESFRCQRDLRDHKLNSHSY